MTAKAAGPHRLLFLAATAKDAATTQAMLMRAGVTVVVCRTFGELLAEIDGDVGAILLTEEAASTNNAALRDYLSAQPSWSDLPILVLTRAGADSPAIEEALRTLGNVTLLERPVRTATLLSAVRTALRARDRQYQIREHLAEHALVANLVATSYDAIVTKDVEGVVTSWNAAAEQLFGYSAAEMIGRPIRRIIPDDRQFEEDEILRRIRRGERIEHFETIRVTKDGRPLTVSVTISPLRDASGNIVGASKIARDTSALRSAEAERVRLIQENADIT